MKKQVILSIALISIFAFALFPAVAFAKPNHDRNFTTHMSGKVWTSRVNSTVTYAIDTHAQGQVIFHVNSEQTEISFKLIVANIQNITMAHIHIDDGKPVGPIVVWLYPHKPPLQLIPGRFNGILSSGTFNGTNLTGPLAGMTIKDLLTKIDQGMAYVVVHTSQHPPGEIRNWIP